MKARAAIAEGIVQSWRDDRGFGFIYDAEGMPYFVHATDLAEGLRPLRPGQRVRFEVVPGVPGNADRAVNVRLAD